MQHSVSTVLSLFIRCGIGIFNGVAKHVQIKSHYKPDLIYNVPARCLTKYTTPCITYFFSIFTVRGFWLTTRPFMN